MNALSCFDGVILILPIVRSMSSFDPNEGFLDDQLDWLAEIKVGADHVLVVAWQVGKYDDLFAQVYRAHFLPG